MKNTEPLDLSCMKENNSPGRDLWPEILKQIETAETKNERNRKIYRMARPFAVMASIAAALIIGISIGSTNFLQRNRVSGYIRIVDNDYKNVERLVLQNLDNSGLPRDVADTVKANLKTIDESVNRIIALLQQDPNSSKLKDKLYKINMKRFDFLESIRDLIRVNTGLPEESSI